MDAGLLRGDRAEIGDAAGKGCNDAGEVLADIDAGVPGAGDGAAVGDAAAEGRQPADEYAGLMRRDRSGVRHAV